MSAAARSPRWILAGLLALPFAVGGVAALRGPVAPDAAQAGPTAALPSASAVAVEPTPSASASPAPSASTAPPAPSASTPAPLPEPSRAPDAELDAARTLTSARDLAKRYPEDVRALLRVAELASNQPAGLAEALTTLRRVLALEPESSPRDPKVRGLVLRGASGPPAVADVAFDLLERSMGAEGPELLYELTIARGVAPAVKRRAAELTKRPALRDAARPALAIALDLRDAPPCARRKLLARATIEGDARSLAYLIPLTATSGCGILDLADCYDECLGDRVDLRRAIQAIQDRAKP